jgi:hypothetical protein
MKVIAEKAIGISFDNRLAVLGIQLKEIRIVVGLTKNIFAINTSIVDMVNFPGSSGILCWAIYFAFLKGKKVSIRIASCYNRKGLRPFFKPLLGLVATNRV